MATRLSFGIFGQSTGQLIDGIAIEVKDASDNVVASTTPSTNQQLVVGNGDGTYYVDGLSTGEYDIYTAGVLQQELKATPFISTAGLNNINNAVTTSDISSTAVNDNAKIWGGALLTTQLAGKEDADPTIIKEGELATSTSTNNTTKAVASSVTHSLNSSLAGKINTSDIVNNVTSTDTNKPLAANQGKVLKDLIDEQYATLNGTNAKTFNTADFTLDNNEVKANNNFSSSNYIQSNYSLVQNLSALDSAIYFGSGSSGGGGASSRIGLLDVQGEEYLDGTIPKTSGSSSVWVYKLSNSIVGNGTTYNHTSKTYYAVKRVDFYKLPWMNQLVWFARGKISGSGTKMYGKLECSGLNIESSAWDSTSNENKGIYLNIDTLGSNAFYRAFLYLQIEYSGTASGEIGQSSLYVKENITSQGGDTTVTINNPVVL